MTDLVSLKRLQDPTYVDELLNRNLSSYARIFIRHLVSYSHHHEVVESGELFKNQLDKPSSEQVMPLQQSVYSNLMIKNKHHIKYPVHLDPNKVL